MTIQIALVLAIFFLTILNFLREWIAIELFALFVIVALVATRVLTPQQAFLGFSNSAIIMIAGVMVLTGALVHNGAADVIARKIRNVAGSSEGRTATMLFATVNGVSAIMNNVAATAMFIPVAERMANRFGVNRRRYLLPIAFASMTGGMCTLIGTSTNVAVTGALEQYGLEPLGMFELTPVGILVALLGMGYFVWVAPHLLDLSPEEDPVEVYRMREYLYEILVRGEATIAGRSLAQADLGGKYGVNVLAIHRGQSRIVSPTGEETLHAGDVLLVTGDADTIPAVRATRGLAVKSMPEVRREDLEGERLRIKEATVSYNSPFIGKTLQELRFRHDYRLNVLAMHRGEEIVLEKVGKIRMRAGDVLLIQGLEEDFDRLDREPTMLLLENLVLPRYNPGRALRGVLILAGAIVAATVGWLDAPTSFLAGGALVVGTGCLSPREASSYLNPKFLVLLAGMATLGSAMEKSGAAAWVAHAATTAFGIGGPIVPLAAFFLMTVVLTQPLNNAAAALLMLPIAIHAAERVGVDPRPFAIAVTLGASCSFITPMEPACLLVYSTGRYRFVDFLRVGGLLTLLAAVVCLLLIPRLWPLTH